ncbi:MAG: 5-(carboxyamino)imidazole ribonucleotide synthase [Ardenticatenaceae bacterium]
MDVGLGPILPGATVGVLGSGQLGRMLAIEARKMGYRVHVLSPERDTPTGQVADREWVAPYDDLDAVRAFARAVDVVTFEFENIPSATADAVGEFVPVRPGNWVLHTVQNRAREKGFLVATGLPVTPFVPVSSDNDLCDAIARIGAPAVLKTVASGYDGKGQVTLAEADEAAAAWRVIGQREAILEAFIPFERELSVVAARGIDGSFAHYGVIENTHHNHILDVSVAPARVPDVVAGEAVRLAQEVMEHLDVVGVLCVEFFLTREGDLLINELAPRPHNSGHLTGDAARTSQFEQQLRAVCGLPLGPPELYCPAAMANLLGDLWENGEPAWVSALAVPGVKLHLYGKAEARPGRKMGHLVATATTPEEAVARVLAARTGLEQGSRARIKGK